jgi:S1-C subfamily serine protease
VKNLLLLSGALCLLIETFAQPLPFLGVTTQDMESQSYSAYNIQDGYGVLITSVVSGSAADRAALNEGMIIRSFNNEKVYTRNQLHKMIDNTSIGEEILISSFKDEQEKSHSVIMGRREEPESSRSPWIGISLNEDLQIEEFKENYGLQVTVVAEDSPAQKAGIKIDDVILKIDSEKLYSQDQVIPMLQIYQPGDNINLLIWRKNILMDLTLTLGERPIDRFDYLAIDDFMQSLDIMGDLEDIYDVWDVVGLPGKLHVLAFQDSASKILGVIVSDIDAETKKQLKLDNGLRIDKVIPQTPADKGEILPGDIILSINAKKIYEFEDISEILADINFNDKFTVTVFRNSKRENLTLRLSPVSEKVWSNYYSQLLENDVIKMILKNKKPIDYYYERLEDLESRFPNGIEIEIKGRDDTGPR